MTNQDPFSSIIWTAMHRLWDVIGISHFYIVVGPCSAGPGQFQIASPCFVRYYQRMNAKPPLTLFLSDHMKERDTDNLESPAQIPLIHLMYGDL